MQQHGFARNLDWSVISSSADPNPDDPEPSVLLTLKDNEYTRSMWDYAFQATYEVTLRRDALRLELAVRNPEQDKKGRGNDDAFDFTAALHTYVEVTDAGDASNVFVKGLEGKTYIDKALDIAEPQREKARGDVDVRRRRRVVRPRVSRDGAGDAAARRHGRGGGGGEHRGLDGHGRVEPARDVAG